MSKNTSKEDWKEEGKYQFIKQLLDMLYEQDNLAVTDWVREAFEDELRSDY